jgi:DNA primase
MTTDFTANLKAQADIVRVIESYVRLKKSGANWMGSCPFHNEKTGSFSVHAARQFFHCFGCGKSGDVFSFVQEIENVAFPDAVRSVAAKFGIEVPEAHGSPEDARLRNTLLDIHAQAAAFFREQLFSPSGVNAMAYLADRGLQPESVATFGIGFAPDQGIGTPLQAMASPHFAECGLFNEKGYPKFRGRIMFPIRNEQGKVIAFTGRALDEKGPKYLNSPETPIYSKSRVLYNLDLAKDAIRKLDYAILVEGQMDCISVYAAGFHNVVASSGTAFTPEQARLLGRFTKNVVVCFDPDDAGEKATERAIGSLLAEDFEVKVVVLDIGYDPDTYIKRRGKHAFTAELKESKPWLDYLLRRAAKHFPPTSPQNKQRAVNYLLPFLAHISSRIVRDEYAKEIAAKLQITASVLEQELQRAAFSRSTTTTVPKAIQISDAERAILVALLSEDGELAELVESALWNERLHEGCASEGLIEAIISCKSSSPFDCAKTDAEKNLLAGILLSDEQANEITVDAALGAMRQVRLRGRYNAIQRELKKVPTDSLLREQLEIKRQLSEKE